MFSDMVGWPIYGTGRLLVDVADEKATVSRELIDFEMVLLTDLCLRSSVTIQL